MSFRASTPKYWARIKDKNLTKDAFILALFVELYPAAHYSGLYSLPGIDIQENTGLTEGEISAAMDELVRDGIALFDRSRMIVFVPGMMLRQLGIGKINAKQEKGIFAHLEGFSKSSPLVTAFLKVYGLTLPDTPTDTPIPYPHPIPVSDTGSLYNLNLRPVPDKETFDLRPTPDELHAEGLSPLDGGEASAPSIKDKGNGNARASGNKRPDLAIVESIVETIPDEYLRQRMIKAYHDVSSGTIPVADALELLDEVPMASLLREELSQRFRAVRQGAN